MKFREYKTNDIYIPKYTKVSHCLFDMDGTILDSEIIYHDTLKEICEKYRRDYNKDLKIRMYGVTDEKICETVCRELKMPISPVELKRQMQDLVSKTLPSAPVLKGAERLLSHLYDYNVLMALATNSTGPAVRVHATARPKLFGMFHHTVSISDVEVSRGKPQPDIYLIAASRFPDKPKPHQCLVFEDSSTGVQSAVAAGMQVVMIPNPRLDRELTRHATLVLKSLLDFRPELFGLPPFDNV